MGVVVFLLGVPGRVAQGIRAAGRAKAGQVVLLVALVLLTMGTGKFIAVYVQTLNSRKQPQVLPVEVEVPDPDGGD